MRRAYGRLRPTVPPPTPDRRERTWLRISAADKMQATYWAEKRGYPSLNEYLAEAVAEQVRRENQDYDLPTLEIARLNELVDQITALSTNVANLEHVVTQGLAPCSASPAGGTVRI